MGTPLERGISSVFVALAERAKSESYGQQQARMMQRLDLDLENCWRRMSGVVMSPTVAASVTCGSPSGSTDTGSIARSFRWATASPAKRWIGPAHRAAIICAARPSPSPAVWLRSSAA